MPEDMSTPSKSLKELEKDRKRLSDNKSEIMIESSNKNE